MFGAAAGLETRAPFLSRSHVHPFAQLGGGEAQGAGELGDVLDAGVASPALDVADVSGVEAGFLGELLLRQLPNITAAADILPQRGEEGVWFRHDS